MNIPSDELDKVFAGLAHKKRRDMLHHLSLHPSTVAQLAQEYELSLPAIHKHIRVLESANLILRKKVGRVNFLTLNRNTLRTVQGWATRYRADWGDDKETLENYIFSKTK